MSRPGWEQLKTTRLIEHSRLRVREDSVRLPTGNDTNYVMLDLPDAVTVIIRRGSHFLLSLEYAYPTDDRIHRPSDVTSDGWLYKFPGGMLRQGETLAQATKREVTEETGLIVANIELLAAVRNFFPRANSRDYKVLAEVTSATTANPDLEESSSVQQWKTANQINTLIQARDHRVLHSHFLDTWQLYCNLTKGDDSNE